MGTLKAAWLAVVMGALGTGCAGQLAELHPRSAEEARPLTMVTVHLRSPTAVSELGTSAITARVLAAILPTDAALAALDPAAPIGFALARMDATTNGRTEALGVAAVAVRLPDAAAAQRFLEAMGEGEAELGAFRLIYQWRRRYRFSLWAKVEGGDIVIAPTQGGLELAGDAARAARDATAAHAVEIRMFPPVFAESQARATVTDAVGAMDRARFGQAAGAAAAVQRERLLADVTARRWTEPFLAARSVAVDIDRDGSDVKVHIVAKPANASQPPAAAIALDERLLAEPAPAAFGSFDCGRYVFANRQALAEAWKVSQAPGGDELLRLEAVKRDALDGSCSFAVHTSDGVFAVDASYGLRPKADVPALVAALEAAIRSGGLPNLETALDDLATAKFLIGREPGALALTRVLGDVDSPRTRFAAAVYGGGSLVDRMTAQDGHLIVYGGPAGKERLQKRGAGGALPAWRQDVKAALAAGRGKAGVIYADLMALWLPFVKASQLSGGDLSKLFADNAGLLEKRLPILATFEPGEGLDATVRTSSETLTMVGALLPW